MAACDYDIEPLFLAFAPDGSADIYLNLIIGLEYKWYEHDKIRCVYETAYMDVEISRDGYIHHDRYEKGVPVVELENGLLPTIGKTKKTGTRINFLPDPEIFEKTRFKEEDVKNRLKETAYLNPKLTIIYEDKRGDATEHIEYHEPEGIIGFVKDLNRCV